jgi:signal peptidase II
MEDRSIGLGWKRAAVLIGALVALDQAVKLTITAWIGPEATSHRFELAGAYLAFEYIENRGAAFGILNGQTTLLIGLALAVGAFFFLSYRREASQSAVLQVALALIAAGAVGNLIDRVRLGYVVDYMAVGIWPKFNIADSCISIAIVLLAWQALIMPDNGPERTPANHDRHAQDRP